MEREGYINTIGGKGTFVAVQNNKLLKERQIKIIEDKLTAVIQEAWNIGMQPDELKHLFNLLLEEDV